MDSSAAAMAELPKLKKDGPAGTGPLAVIRQTLLFPIMFPDNSFLKPNKFKLVRKAIQKIRILRLSVGTTLISATHCYYVNSRYYCISSRFHTGTFEFDFRRQLNHLWYLCGTKQVWSVR